MTRAAVTLSATLLAYSSKSWSCLSTNFCFSSTIFLGSSTQKKFDPLGSASPPQVAQSFRQPFATSRVKRVNIKRIKIQKEKLEEMMTSLHRRMSRGLSVSLNHKKHTSAAKPCQNIISRRILLGSFWSINSDLQSCLKTMPTRDLLFRSWWPFPPLPSLISLGDVSCPLPSDLLGKTLGEKKKEKKK